MCIIKFLSYCITHILQCVIAVLEVATIMSTEKASENVFMESLNGTSLASQAPSTDGWPPNYLEPGGAAKLRVHPASTGTASYKL